MKLNIAQVVGLNTDQKAAQVISNSRNGEDYFFAVLILSCDDAFTRGRQALSELSDFYFDLEEGTVGEKLTVTFEQAKKKLEAEFSILLASVSGKVLYLEGLGGVEVYLKRAQNLSPLNSGSSGQLISGFLQENDRLLFATHNLITFLGEDLEKSLELPIETFEEAVTDRLGAEKVEDEGLAALLIEAEPALVETEAAGREETVTPNEDIPNLQQEENPIEPAYPNADTPKLTPMTVFKKTILPSLNFIWQKRNNFPKSNRGRLILAVVLIVVIALGVVFTVKAKKESSVQSDFKTALQAAKDDLNAAKGLSTLNSAEAKLKLDKAKDEVNKAVSLKPKDTEAQELKKQIEQDTPVILQQFTASEFPLFLDLDLIKKNFRATQMSMSGGKILLLDPMLKTLVAVDITKKSNQILAGLEQLGDANFASLNGDLAFVYSKDKGILRIDTTNQKTAVVSKKDDSWGIIRDLYSFAGNVYVLDSGQVWKYLPTPEGYSDKREYLSKNSKVDLADALRMQIESSVYVLKSGGEVLRFTRGEKDNFSFEGLPTPANSPKSMFVSSETDNLYLLDSGNSRLLILSKTGSYKSQIMGDKFATVTDLAVDEAGKKVYLLDGSKIYTVELK